MSKDKRTQFQLVAGKRLKRALDQLAAIAKMGTTSRYRFTPEDIETICNKLDFATRKLRNELTAAIPDDSEPDEDPDFTFGGF